MTRCSDCGANYSDLDDSCQRRFDQLLALDHSRQEPWGSRHGLAFATFALQHPSLHATSLDAAWFTLCAVYRGHHDRRDVAIALRRIAGGALPNWDVPPRPTSGPPTAFNCTIRDMNDFGADTYPAALDRWATATLEAWAR